MSKAFADVAEFDTLKIAVIWRKEPVQLITRILIAEDERILRSLCAKSGAAAFESSGFSQEALRLLKLELSGKNGQQLEEMLDLSELKPFQSKVLKTLREHVAWGRAVSYGELAKLCGKPGGARAVGQAMGANPYPLFYPCHRVVAADCSLGGFGFGTALKITLLEREGIAASEGKAAFKTHRI